MAGLSRRQPIEFMTSCCVNLRDHVRLKSVEEMRRQAFAATLFSGAFLFIDAINPDGTTHPAVTERIRGIYAETAPYEPFLGGTAVAEIALYFSDDSRMDFSENGTATVAASYWNNQFPHSQAVRGLCRMLQVAHLPFTIITRKDLPELSRYRVVALPNVLRLTVAECEAFRCYVQNGGHLYASGQTSLTESCGVRHADFLLADVLGCHADLTIDRGSTFYLKPATAAVAAALEPQLYLSHFQKVATSVAHASGATAVPLAACPSGETLATLTLPYASPHSGTVADQAWASIHSSPPWQDLDVPTLVRHAFGQGVAVYAAAPLETVEAEANQRLLTALFREFLGPRPAFSATAHPAVWMNVQQQPERHAFTIAFLNNQTQEPPLPIPAWSFTLRCPANARFTSLRLAPELTPVPFTLDAAKDLHAELRDLTLFRLLVAEYELEADGAVTQGDNQG